MAEELSPTITLKVAVLARELWSGDHLAHPLASEQLAAFGTETDVEEELRLFLKDHLSRIAAPVLSMFTLPAATRLETLEIEVPREDLPQRLAFEQRIAFSAIVIPFQREAWVIVPKLDHTFYVGKNEDLAKETAAEVRRMAAARELSPTAWLELLPSRKEELRFYDIEVTRAERSPHGKAANLEKE